MMSGWASSSPSPSARNDEVIKLAQRISIGESGNMDWLSLSLKTKPMRRSMTWAILEMSRWRIN